AQRLMATTHARAAPHSSGNQVLTGFLPRGARRCPSRRRGRNDRLSPPPSPAAHPIPTPAPLSTGFRARERQAARQLKGGRPRGWIGLPLSGRRALEGGGRPVLLRGVRQPAPAAPDQKSAGDYRREV